MKKQQKQPEQVIDLDSFDDEISLWKLVPCGRVGHSMLRTIIDSVHYNAQFSSLLIAGSDGLTTTATCFLKALGCTAINQIDACLLQDTSYLYRFLFAEQQDGYMISNIEDLQPCLKLRLYFLLKDKQFKAYNYRNNSYDIFELENRPVILTTKHLSKVPDVIKNHITHIVQLEEYTEQQLILVVLQRLLASHITYESETVLQKIVGFGKNLEQCLRVLRLSITVMQSDARQELTVKDVEKAARLNRLTKIETDADIPF